MIEPDGRITVTTEAKLFRFARDGSLVDQVSLTASDFEAPQPEYDASGNLWLTFASDSVHGVTRVVEFDRALKEIFNRTLPFYSASASDLDERAETSTSPECGGWTAAPPVIGRTKPVWEGYNFQD